MKFICVQFSLAIKIVPLNTIKKRKREVRCWMLRWKQLWWWGWWRYCDCVCAHVCACVFVRVCMRHTWSQGPIKTFTSSRVRKTTWLITNWFWTRYLMPFLRTQWTSINLILTDMTMRETSLRLSICVFRYKIQWRLNIQPWKKLKEEKLRKSHHNLFLFTVPFKYNDYFLFLSVNLWHSSKCFYLGLFVEIKMGQTGQNIKK